MIAWLCDQFPVALWCVGSKSFLFLWLRLKYRWEFEEAILLWADAPTKIYAWFRGASLSLAKGVFHAYIKLELSRIK